jgi:diacylglycerol kinase (ATP)
MGKSVNKPTSFWQSCQGALNGIIFSLKTERHLRFHFFASIVVILLGMYVRLELAEWLFVIYAMGSVIVAELFNTALERTIDLVQPGFHPMAGIAKDIAAGAVLVTAVQSVIIGILVFGPYLYLK